MKTLPSLFSVLVMVAVLAGCGSGGSTTAQPITEGGAGAMAGIDVDGGSAGPTTSPEQGANPGGGDDHLRVRRSPRRRGASGAGSAESNPNAAARSKRRSQAEKSPPPRKKSQSQKGRQPGHPARELVRKLLPAPTDKSQGSSTQGGATRDGASKGSGEAESSSPDPAQEIVEQVVGGDSSGDESVAGGTVGEAMLEGLAEAGH